MTKESFFFLDYIYCSFLFLLLRVKEKENCIILISLTTIKKKKIRFLTAGLVDFYRLDKSSYELLD